MAFFIHYIGNYPIMTHKSYMTQLFFASNNFVSIFVTAPPNRFCGRDLSGGD